MASRGPNSWQKAQEKKRIATLGDAYQEIINTMAEDVRANKEKVLVQFVQEETGETIINPREFVRRGYLAQAEDGSEVFHWDGHPRIYFAPILTQNVGGTLRPVLKWQRIPLPGTEAPEEGQDLEAQEQESPAPEEQE